MGSERAPIPTTHAGSLPRPGELAALMVGRETGELLPDDAARLPDLVREAIATVVRQQVDTGLDIISDGEMGKIGAATYQKERLSGFDGEATPLSLADLA